MPSTLQRWPSRGHQFVHLVNTPFPHSPSTGICVFWSIHSLTQIVSGTAKGGLISEGFSLWLKSQKKVANPTRALYVYPPEEKMFKIVIWHLFFADLSEKEKKNLRLSHL